MLHENHLRYFFSIQPFWDMGRMENFIRSDHISVSEFRWIHDVMSCVPGNGQLGIMLSGPEDFSGYCFGVADCRDEIPLSGMTTVSSTHLVGAGLLHSGQRENNLWDRMFYADEHREQTFPGSKRPAQHLSLIHI